MASKTSAEFRVEAKADAIVDAAMAAADLTLSRDERQKLRRIMQDSVEALIDACRDYYRAL